MVSDEKCRAFVCLTEWRRKGKYFEDSSPPHSTKYWTWDPSTILDQRTTCRWVWLSLSHTRTWRLWFLGAPQNMHVHACAHVFLYEIHAFWKLHRLDSDHQWEKYGNVKFKMCHVWRLMLPANGHFCYISLISCFSLLGVRSSSVTCQTTVGQRDVEQVITKTDSW